MKLSQPSDTQVETSSAVRGGHSPQRDSDRAITSLIQESMRYGMLFENLLYVAQKPDAPELGLTQLFGDGQEELELQLMFVVPLTGEQLPNDELSLGQ